MTYVVLLVSWPIFLFFFRSMLTVWLIVDCKCHSVVMIIAKRHCHVLPCWFWFRCCYWCCIVVLPAISNVDGKFLVFHFNIHISSCCLVSRSVYDIPLESLSSLCGCIISLIVKTIICCPVILLIIIIINCIPYWFFFTEYFLCVGGALLILFVRCCYFVKWILVSVVVYLLILLILVVVDFIFQILNYRFYADCYCYRCCRLLLILVI